MSSRGQLDRTDFDGDLSVTQGPGNGRKQQQRKGYRLGSAASLSLIAGMKALYQRYSVGYRCVIYIDRTSCTSLYYAVIQVTEDSAWGRSPDTPS